MLLLIICIFFNYDLFTQAKKFSGKPNQGELAEMEDRTEHEMDVLIRELREKIRRAQSAETEFGGGVEDYNIPPMNDFKTTNVHTGENDNLLDKDKDHHHAEHENDGFMNYDITNMFWTGIPTIGDPLTTPKPFLPTPQGFTITPPPTLLPWEILEQYTRPETAAAPGTSTILNPDYPDPFHEGFSLTTYKFDTPNVVYIPHYMLNSTDVSRPSFPFSVPTGSTPPPLMVPVSINNYHTGDGITPSMYTGPILDWDKHKTKPVTTTTTVRTTTTTSTTEATTTTISTTLYIGPPVTFRSASNSHEHPAEPSVMSEPKVKTGIRIDDAKTMIEEADLLRDKFNITESAPNAVVMSEPKVKPGIRIDDAKTMIEEADLLRDKFNITESMPNAVANRPPVRGRTLSKAESKLHDKEWTELIGGPKPTNKSSFTTKSTIYKPPSIPSTLGSPSGNESALVDQTTMTVSNLYTFSPNEDGFMEIHTPISSPIIDNHLNETPTTAGAALLQPETLTTSTTPSPKMKYLQMMDDLDEGFLGVFLLEFLRLLSEKDVFQVQEVMIHAEPILNKLEQQGALKFLGEKLAQKAKALSMVFTDSGHKAATFQNLTILAYRMMQLRRQVVEGDVNYVIDTASAFYDDDDGRFLFKTLMDFENYPKVELTGEELCEQLIDAFSRPFRKMSQTTRGAELRYLAEEAVRVRFGRRMSYQGLMKLSDTETTTVNHLSNNKQTYSFKQRMEIKRRRKILTRRVFGTAGVMLAQQTNRPMTRPRLRSLLPITRNQKRFRVQQRRRAVTKSANMERPTRKDHFRRSGRVVHPYNDMLQFFPQIPNEYLRRAL